MVSRKEQIVALYGEKEEELRRVSASLVVLKRVVPQLGRLTEMPEVMWADERLREELDRLAKEIPSLDKERDRAIAREDELFEEHNEILERRDKYRALLDSSRRGISDAHIVSLGYSQSVIDAAEPLLAREKGAI